MSKAIAGHYYRHFNNGHLYRILHLGFDEATGKNMVVYQHWHESRDESASTDDQVWVRDRENFEAEVPEFSKLNQSNHRFFDLGDYHPALKPTLQRVMAAIAEVPKRCGKPLPDDWFDDNVHDLMAADAAGICNLGFEAQIKAIMTSPEEEKDLLEGIDAFVKTAMNGYKGRER